MSNAGHPFEGVLLVDKPTGMTSHDVVDRLRRKLGMKRIGHAGTLDPIATGLLILLVGKATKISQFLMGMDKAYEGTARLGQETDSHDADGEIVAEKDVPDFTEDEIRTRMETFLGDQYQLPPMFSAKKIGGQPLYKMARKGKTVEREERFIRIGKFDFTRWENPELDFFVTCSKGTYVRTLLHDLGQKLGCGAHLTALRRTAIEDFRIEDAATLREIEEADVATLHRMLRPAYQVVPSHML